MTHHHTPTHHPGLTSTLTTLTAILPVLAVVVVLTLTACANSGGSGAGAVGSAGGGPTVARVAGTPITRGAVDHWMNTLIGGDYYELSKHHTVPPELVSDPPNYTRCVKQLELATASAPKQIVHLTPLERLEKCRQLNEALKEQATNYLITGEWVINFNHTLGITATNKEVEKLFKKIKAEQYPTPTAQEHYLQSQHLTLNDEMYIIKLDVLKNKDSAQVQTGGQTAYNKILNAEHHTNTTITCQPGYIVAHCPQYTQGEEQNYRTTPSPAVLMEQIAAIATGRCINYAACLKT